MLENTVVLQSPNALFSLVSCSYAFADLEMPTSKREILVEVF